VKSISYQKQFADRFNFFAFAETKYQSGKDKYNKGRRNK